MLRAIGSLPGGLSPFITMYGRELLNQNSISLCGMRETGFAHGCNAKGFSLAEQ